MPRVRFDGPAHRLIIQGRVVPRGGFATFTDEELEQLQSQKNIRLTVVKTPKRPAPPEPEAHEGEGQPLSTEPQEE